MIPFLLTLIENIWIVSAVIIFLCLLSLKIFGKVLGSVAKIIILVVIAVSVCIALGLTTSAELKDMVTELISNTKDFNAEDYKNLVNNSSEAEQFIE